MKVAADPTPASMAARVQELSSLRTADRPFAILGERIRSRTARVSVVGQGYVGFPLAQAAASAGFPVVGIDLDSSVVQRCMVENRAQTYSGTTLTDPIGDCDVALVAVPTPTRVLKGVREPDTSLVRHAVETVLGQWQDDREHLLIVESTYAPGTTRNLVGELVRARSPFPDRVALGYSPERIDPGNAVFSLTNTPKVVSGEDAASADLVSSFYESFVEVVVRASSLEVAEASKLLENTFRLVNIAFAQEFDDYCETLGLQATEVVDLAATKPFGFMPFYPGAGVGGHCIAEDPYFLRDSMLSNGSRLEILQAVLENHEQRVFSIIRRVAARLGDVPLHEARILILGVSYKPGIADARRSPAEPLVELLELGGAAVSFSDPLVGSFLGRPSMAFSSLSPDNFDIAILVTRHQQFDPGVILSAGWNLLDVSAKPRHR